VNFSAVQRYLTEHPEIHKISIALDNDAAGKKAAEELQHKLKANFPDSFFAVGFSCSIFKDWNEDLLKFRSSTIPIEQFITMTAENIDNTPDDNEQQECYL